MIFPRTEIISEIFAFLWSRSTPEPQKDTLLEVRGFREPPNGSPNSRIQKKIRKLPKCKTGFEKIFLMV